MSPTLIKGKRHFDCSFSWHHFILLKEVIFRVALFFMLQIYYATWANFCHMHIKLYYNAWPASDLLSYYSNLERE